MDFTTDLIEAVYAEVIAPKKVVAIYPGRFQPPGRHHFDTYKWLADKFGADNVYIATSDIVKLPDNPLNFSEKKMVWLKYGVPANRIVKVKSPYSAEEIVSTLPKNTSVIFTFGEKDAGRISIGKKKDGSPSYFQSYEKNKGELETYEKHGYVLTLPHISIDTVSGKEMSGTEIRSILSSPHNRKQFFDIFGWYDPNIDKLLSSKFNGAKSAPLNEGGHMFGDIISLVKKENLDSTIKHTLKLYGLDQLPYSKIGNYQKPLMNDIDISIDTDDLAKFLGVNSDKNSVFDAIKVYFDKHNVPKSYGLAPSLYQIHLLGIAVTPDGELQEFIGNPPKEGSSPFVQLDIMLGVRKWREKWFSGAPESEYKAKYRNLFIAEIFSKLIEEEGGSIEGLKKKYLISSSEGLFIQKFTLLPNGKKKEVSRELKSTDMDFVAKFLFGEDKTFSDINTFEKVYNLFKSDDFKFPEIRQEVINSYKQSLAKHSELPHPRLNEARHSIQRFSGTNEMSDTAFLKFLEKLQPLVKSGKLDLSVSDSVSVTEKLDGAGCTFGIDKNGKFFMESASSGEVTISQAEKFNNAFTNHFYHALLFLNSYQPFQKRLQLVFSSSGAFKVSSEMFAVLTHKGDAFGDIVFATTKYSKSKLGNKGAFVCFSGSSEKASSEEILAAISDTEDSEWKVYDINKQGGLPRQDLIFNLSGIQDLIEDPVKLSSAMALLKKRKDSPEKDALTKVILNAKKQLQNTLNQYAERINSFLSSGQGKYPVEGVVMKVHLPDEDIFIKGTSEMFNQIKLKTWGTRSTLGDIETVFNGDFLINVLGLKTAHKATINQAIESARQRVGKGTDETTLNKVALELYKTLEGKFDPNTIKQKAIETLERSTKSLNATLNKWKTVKPTVDPDTATKTDDQIKYILNRFKKLKEAIENTRYQGMDYVIYLLRLLLDKKINNSEDSI